MRLSEDEELVLRLYHESDSVDFYKHTCIDGKEAAEYAALLDEEPILDANNGRCWYESKKGKIDVTGFFDKEKAPSATTE